MRFIRFLGSALLLTIVLIALLAAAAFVPAVQTWAAQRVLAKQTFLEGSLGSFSLGFDKVEIGDLRLKMEGADLTLPSLQARLPLTTAAWHRKVLIRSLVAKGWTLDLSRTPESPAPPPQANPPSEDGGAAGAPVRAEAVPPQKVERIFLGILSKWRLPCDLSLDGVDLEGDVLVAGLFGKAPDRVHIVFKGGGLAAGREGAFTLDAAGFAVDPSLQVYSGAGHGRVALAMDSPRTIQRVEIAIDLSVKGGSLPADLTLSVDLAAARASGGETCTLDISRGRRRLANVSALIVEATRRAAGSWKIDWRDSDLAPFIGNFPLPSVATTGEGGFETGPDFDRVHATGRFNAMASRLSVLAPSLASVGPVTLDTRFDLTEGGKSIRFDRLDISVAGTRPVAELRSLQPFALDWGSGSLTPTDPRADWMEGSIRGFPLAWLSGLTGGFTLAGGDATGEFVVKTAHDGFALRPKMPLTAAAVSVRRGGRLLGRGLDLSLSLLAEYAAGGWQVRWAPFTVASAGRHLASFEAQASRLAGSEQPIAITGTWSADLEVLAAQLAVCGTRLIAGRSASGDFSAKLGAATEAEAKLVAVGHDPSHAVTVGVQADVDADGGVAFLAPVKFATGQSVSEVSVEGTWSSGEDGSQFDAKLTGENVALEHLRWLVAPLAAAGGALSPAGSAAGTETLRRQEQGRDRIPFWGSWAGRLAIAFDQLRAGSHDLKNVAGTFDFDHQSLHLTGGRVELQKRRLATLEGAITFDAAAEFPYGLKAAAAVDVVDAAPYFAQSKAGQDPVMEGRFSVAGTLTGKGVNLTDLFDRTQEEFRLTSTTGIVRLLATNVSESITPPTSSGVSDTLGTVGSAVGSLFGIWRKTDGSDAIQLSKNTEAVLDFSYRMAEIGCDEISITGIRGPDRTIHLLDIKMIAPDERLTGSGSIAHVEGRPWSAQPLTLDLQLGARGRIAQLLSTAGLLSSRKDESGYTMLSQPIHFGGTLEKIDKSQWHDLLVKAATRKPDSAKKGASK